MSDAVTTSITLPVGNMTYDTTASTISISNGNGMSTVLGTAIPFDMEYFLDEYSLNKVTVDHKVQEHELMKLKETVPTYVDEIKENLSKNLARDIIKKATFTKKHDKDADVHHFLGRVWVFTEEELKTLIKEARNV